jgi:hypothetical protein
MAVVLMPLFFRLDDYPLRPVHDEIARWCAEEGIPLLDVLPLFEGYDARELIVHPMDHHPNARAHRVIGEATARFFRELLAD